jgi:ketosteroid isomerase-like protein
MNKEGEGQTMNASAIDPGAVLRAANDAIALGDIEGFLECCSDDTTWEFVGDVVLQGKRAVRAWMTETYEHPPVNDVELLVVEGNVVVATGTVVVTRDDTPTRSRYCDIWRVSDGKLAELSAFVVAEAS